MIRPLIGVGYARTSGLINPVASIPNQKKLICDYCKDNNIILKEILIDEHKTGTKVDGRTSYKN